MSWIKVGDRLPVDCNKTKDKFTSTEVIVFDGEEVFITDFQTGYAPTPWGEFMAPNITHWMFFPSAPKQ